MTHRKNRELEAENARLSEALAAAQRVMLADCNASAKRAEAAEARVRELEAVEADRQRLVFECAALLEQVRELRDIERTLRSSSANQRILAAIDAIESAQLATGSCEAAWAKQALGALRQNEVLRAEKAQTMAYCEHWCRECIDARKQLAAANALLARWADTVDALTAPMSAVYLKSDTETHLSAQPAAPTDHDRAVLEQLWKDCKEANNGLAEMHSKVVRLVTDHTLVSDGGLRHQLAQELGVQLQSSYWSSPARARCESLRVQLEAEKVHAAGVVAMNATCIRDRDRARAALEAIRPVAAALDAWGHSWIDANASPDPDDLPEEAALFEAWKAVAERVDLLNCEPYVPCKGCGTLTNSGDYPLCLSCSNLGGP